MSEEKSKQVTVLRRGKVVARIQREVLSRLNKILPPTEDTIELTEDEATKLILTEYELKLAQQRKRDEQKHIQTR